MFSLPLIQREQHPVCWSCQQHKQQPTAFQTAKLSRCNNMNLLHTHHKTVAHVQ
uniref:Uncharacterized protein n=1 Tax=Anguilla anguilla TaxID=7936 RepID=A0A0E9XH44_ANGAN